MPEDDEATAAGAARPESGGADPEVHAGKGNFWTRTGMPPWIPRLLLLIFITYALGSWVLTQVGHLGYFIRIIAYSLFISFALEPAVDWLEEHGWRRGLGTAFVMVVGFVLGVAVVASMVPLVAAETGRLADQLPEWIDQADPTLRDWFGIDVEAGSRYSVSSYLDDHLSDWAGGIAGNAVVVARNSAGLLLTLLSIALFSFYLIADAHRVRRGLCSLFRPELQEAILRGWEISIKKMGGFLYSRLLLGLVIGVATYVVLRILGVPYAAPLAVWMAFFAEFIPNIGTYIGAAVPLVVCALEKGLAPFLVLLVFVLVYQQFENYVLSPRIAAHTMQLHPAVAFGAAIVGGSLFGIMGAFLALPVAAIIQAVVSTYVHRYDLIDNDLLRDHDPDTPD